MTKIELIEAPEWHYTDGPDEDPNFEPDITDVDVTCDFCETGIGWTEYTGEGPHGEDIEGHRWVEYYEITRDGDDKPTLLCEDDCAWVGAVGADVAAYLAEWQAAHSYAADLARSAALTARNMDGQGLHR